MSSKPGKRQPTYTAEFRADAVRLVEQSGEGICMTPLTTHAGRRVGSREYVRRAQTACSDRLVVRTHALATRGWPAGAALAGVAVGGFGVELLGVRRLGVDLDGLPERETLERILTERQIRVLQP